MSDRPPASLGFLTPIIAAWPVLVGLVISIGFIYSLNDRVAGLSDRVDGIQSTQNTMLSRNIATRVQVLEQGQLNQTATTNLQITGLQGQVQSLQSQVHDMTSTVNSMSGGLAQLQAQIAFMINQYQPPERARK